MNNIMNDRNEANNNISTKTMTNNNMEVNTMTKGKILLERVFGKELFFATALTYSLAVLCALIALFVPTLGETAMNSMLGLLRGTGLDDIMRGLGTAGKVWQFFISIVPQAVMLTGLWLTWVMARRPWNSSGAGFKILEVMTYVESVPVFLGGIGGFILPIGQALSEGRGSVWTVLIPMVSAAVMAVEVYYIIKAGKMYSEGAKCQEGRMEEMTVPVSVLVMNAVAATGKGAVLVGNLVMSVLSLGLFVNIFNVFGSVFSILGLALLTAVLTEYRMRKGEVS